MSGLFEIFTDADQGYRFRLRDASRRHLATSPAYQHKSEAISAIAAVRESAATGHVVDLCPADITVSAKPHPFMPLQQPSGAAAPRNPRELLQLRLAQPMPQDLNPVRGIHR